MSKDQNHRIDKNFDTEISDEEHDGYKQMGLERWINILLCR